MFTPVKRVSAQRLFSSGAVSAFKSDKLQEGLQASAGSKGDPAVASAAPSSEPEVRGPLLTHDNVWRNDGGGALAAASVPVLGGAATPQHPFSTAYSHATRPGPQTHYELLQAAAQPQPPLERSMPALQLPPSRIVAEDMTFAEAQHLSQQWTGIPVRTPVMDAGALDDQPAVDMEAFLQELALSDSSSSQQDLSYFEPLESGNGGGSGLEYNGGGVSSPMAASYDAMKGLPAFNAPFDPLLTLAAVDPAKAAHHLNAMTFDALHALICRHIWNMGPMPDIFLFYLFRKVHRKDQADQAVGALITDREVRASQGITVPYSEVTSAAVFNALNRTGGEALVVAAAEKSFELGLTLSRSNMYHLMKQYSVQGKVDHVEKLFRALEASGKSWNSNCIVIMMLAYFNQGRFEDADRLRRELTARGIKISERIETRLDKLLAGEEKWRWEDKVFYRPKRVHLTPPPGFHAVHPIMHPMMTRQGIFGRPAMTSSYTTSAYIPQRTMQTEPVVQQSGQETGQEFVVNDLPPVTLKEAVKEPRIHLNILRSAGFEDLHSVLCDFVRVEGPVENVCISFLFRKVETRQHVEKAMAFLKDERSARATAGISEEYNETTCSRIFTALFRTGASDLAFNCAENAHETGLVLSGKALHELLKSFATRNDVEKVEEIWKLVKLNGKPSSRIVYSIFRTYFDNGMMEKASAFHNEIQSIGIKLSASATRNIEDVLSGAKSWVRDPHSNEF